MSNRIVFTILEIIFITFFGVGVSGMGFECYPSWFMFFGFLGFSSTTYLFVMSLVQKHLYKQLSLTALKSFGTIWGKQYKYLKAVFLFRTIPGVSSDNEAQSKYTLFFKFKGSKRGMVEKEKFIDLTWEQEAYPISECKADFYREDPPNIDLLFEWNIVTEKPKAVDKRSYFVVFRRKLMGII